MGAHYPLEGISMRPCPWSIIHGLVSQVPLAEADAVF